MQNFISNLYQLLRQHVVVVGFTFAISFIALSFYGLTREQTVHLKYAGDNCISDITWLPNLHEPRGEGTYSLRLKNVYKVKGKALLSRSTCFDTKRPPQENGKDQISMVKFKLPFLKKNYGVMAGEHPQLNVAVLNHEISVIDPINFQLSKPDSLFAYHLNVEERKSSCVSSGSQITCEVAALKLEQGAQYKLAIEKSFKTAVVSTLTEKTIKTAEPVSVVGTPFAGGTIIYDVPTEFKLNTDKELQEATATLWQLTGAEKKKVEQTSILSGKDITIKLSQPLPRESKYELVLERASSADKGQLIKPYTLPFMISGGPKVAGINIGTSSVDPAASIIVTLDQKPAAGQDFSKLFKLTNGTAPIAFTAYVQGQKVTLRPAQSLGKCSPLRLQLSADVKSAYGIGGSSAWNYSSRIICHTIITIGTSAQGRAIQAWKFGGGASKIVYVAATHGDEKSTKYLMDKWIGELNAYPDRIPAHRTIFVIPNLNPDGFAAGSRRNARNVDLNRNFPTSNWKSDVTMPGGELVIKGAGTEPLSEPESKALADFVKTEKPRLVLTYHSIASIVSGNGAGDSLGLATAYSKLSKYQNLLPSQTSAVFEYDITGSFEDWLAEKESMVALLVELGSDTNHEFSRNRDAMWSMATF